MDRQPRPLDDASLRQLAITYVGRYATTQAKLAAYLRRKLCERGWREQHEADIDGLVLRLSELNYVDDEAYGLAKAGALKRKGLGAFRVKQALHAAGIDRELSAVLSETNADEAFDAAMLFARRKRIGPFSQLAADAPLKARWTGALLRAGHSADLARKIVTLTREQE
jgi:regulatory protein